MNPLGLHSHAVFSAAHSTAAEKRAPAEDNEGQTALHYASACEFAEIVELLLNSGADPSIKDMEGSLPEEVTESSAISSLLRQHTAPKG
ncbi:unnamed protein product [Pleuronectes platessa]|uniref:Uncharacterized protein n=1 Tax=Pleuronectes platessa TaxID=8262 RepID=A0A9N7Y6L5_PLEPL|nr:unnamed protein product [Pleuronectes platessa]